MPWFKMDDGFYDHPKVCELEDSAHFGDAIALWTLAGCWSSKHLTDGAVPGRRVRKLGFKPVHAQALVSVGLWSETDDGYQFHDWTDHQPSRADVEAKRESERKRKRKPKGVPAAVPRGRLAEDQAESDAPSDYPDPTRPVPAQPDQEDPPKAPQGAGLWSGRFDQARASEYLQPLSDAWGGSFPQLRFNQQRDVAERLHRWMPSDSADADVEARCVAIVAWTRRDFQPKNKVELLLSGDLDEALDAPRGKAATEDREQRYADLRARHSVLEGDRVYAESEGKTKSVARIDELLREVETKMAKLKGAA